VGKWCYSDDVDQLCCGGEDGSDVMISSYFDDETRGTSSTGGDRASAGFGKAYEGIASKVILIKRSDPVDRVELSLK